VYLRDTIAAVATAAGPAAVAVVRISGTDAEPVATRVFRGSSPASWKNRRLYLGELADSQGRVLDRAMGVIMRAPHSYTGEDVVELHCHGGVLLARRLLEAVLAAGARSAERGEFTLRAFLNGKLDLAQAESVADLIAARTTPALDAAARQLEGALSRVVEELRARLIGIAAHLEVAIDFAEEDVGALDRAALAADADGVASRARDLAATYARGRIVREGLRVAIVGKPNVGKSSLLNRLLGSDRAIVTTMPGTTRDLIEESLNVGGIAVVLIDTAGLRAAEEPVERIGIDRTRDAMASADLVLAVFDSSRPWEREDQQVIDAMRHQARILVLNKADLPRAPGFADEVLHGPWPAIRVSAVTGNGIVELENAIAGSICREDDEGGVVVTRERHRAALECASGGAERAASALRAGLSPDLVGVDIQAALGHLGQITGRTSPEDVLDRIFQEFCIGK
jgi:tRNA modification GTPase